MKALIWGKNQALEGEVSPLSATDDLSGTTFLFELGKDFRAGTALLTVEDEAIVRLAATASLIRIIIPIDGAALATALTTETRTPLKWQLTVQPPGSYADFHQGTIQVKPGF